MVADGEPVPKGGGRELVGKPYVVAGRTYVPTDSRGYVREGLASWYKLYGLKDPAGYYELMGEEQPT